MLDFEAFRGLEHYTAARPMQGDYWTYPELGIDELRIHPKHLIDAETMRLVRLWSAHRRGGQVNLPDPGGINDQAAFVLEAFDIMEGACADLAKRREGGKGVR